MDKFAEERFIAPKSPPIAILGVPFDSVSTSETIKMIEEMIRSRRPHYLATANVDFLAQAGEDVELRRILFDAHLVLCAGTPLVWASKFLGNRLPERVAGSDLVPLLLKVCAEKGYRPFLLGASPETLEAAVQRTREQYPTIEFAGYYSPPFNKLLEMDHEAIREKILRAEPDILFVAFGCPKQEKWINMHYRSLGVPVSVGVGGTIDFLAGRLERAPIWMQKTGTEWIFRLWQEPRRLFRRYTTDFWHFSSGLLQQLWRLRSRPMRPRNVTTAAKREVSKLAFEVLEAPARLDCEEVQLRHAEFEELITPQRNCVIDLAHVQFIDSTGIGLLVRLQKRARAAGQQLILASLSEPVRRALDLMRLTEFFVIVPSIEAAETHLKEMEIGRSSVSLRTTSVSNLPALVWSGELTAANAEDIWIQTMDQVSARSLVQSALTIDLAHLRFIDSTGLGVMVRTRKYAVRQGLKLRFTNPAENVSNVIRFSQLEEYLLEND